MTHRFPIKEIARQAALGTATVDRVLNGRAHVSAQTRNRVVAAITELELQEQQLTARGRRMFVDIVVEAPRRFSDEIKRTTNAILDTVTAGVFRPRFVFQETMGAGEIEAVLARIVKRGSHGVCLKARDTPDVRDAINALDRAGIPVVTLVTDIPASRRAAYVGVDNLGAGRTAAFLVAKMLGQSKGTVFATRSQDAFFGEAERLRQFSETLGQSAPGLKVIDIVGGAGLPGKTADLFNRVLAKHGPPAAIYSMGGGNAAIFDALAARTLCDLVFIAHDLDAENRRLLEKGKLSFVLQHDLKTDMRHALMAIAARHGLARPAPEILTSDLQIVSPFNMPS
ncbi:MAG: LacI family DNA-binding transcriptional regulator [Pseudomonadota bacterium]